MDLIDFCCPLQEKSRQIINKQPIKKVLKKEYKNIWCNMHIFTELKKKKAFLWSNISINRYLKFLSFEVLGIHSALYRHTEVLQ